MSGHIVRHARPKADVASSAPKLPRRGGRARIWTPRNIAVLCDVIADGGTFEEAARACKVSEMQAAGRFKSIVHSYGWQGK